MLMARSGGGEPGHIACTYGLQLTAFCTEKLYNQVDTA